jgi:predicted metal-dependent enzyme (double-stranded beta helix superfamily)
MEHTNIARLRAFVTDTTVLITENGDNEAALLDALTPRLRELIAVDDWLADDYAAPDPASYRQYLLHADPLERFSVVSFVWGPGQSTPIHDHGVWGLIGMLRGAERSTAYSIESDGRVTPGEETQLMPGDVAAVSPWIGDLHRVVNGAPGVSVSIHVYGGNIGAIRRRTFDPITGAAKMFVSGYSNSSIPNLWDRSAEMRLV